MDVSTSGRRFHEGKKTTVFSGWAVELKCQGQGQGDASEGFRLSTAQQRDRCQSPLITFLSGTTERPPGRASCRSLKLSRSLPPICARRAACSRDGPAATWYVFACTGQPVCLHWQARLVPDLLRTYRQRAWCPPGCQRGKFLHDGKRVSGTGFSLTSARLEPRPGSRRTRPAGGRGSSGTSEAN